MDPRIIRTLVPIVVGWLASVPLVRLLGLDQTTLTSAVTAGLAAAWYLCARLLERWHPIGGLLMLGARQPGRHEAPE
jgi:hypothetical protein